MSSDLNTKLATSNSIQEEWNLEKIDNVCELVREPFTPSDDDIRKYVGLEHIEQGTLKLCGIGSSSCVKSNKLQFRSGQILFGKLRPYFRKVIRPDFDGVCSTDILVIDSKKGYDNGYLFYFFANNEMIEEATRSSEGTRMPRASWKYLSQLKKPFPSLPEQRAIAEILSSLDDKIKLNRRMNATLEHIAQAIFKRWFIDFEFPDENGQPYKSSGGEMVESELGEIPRGWGVKAIGDILELAYGKSLPKKKRISGPYPVYGSGGISGYHNKPLLNGPGIIVGRKGTIGSVFWVEKDFYPIDTVFFVKLKSQIPLYWVFMNLQRMNFAKLSSDSAVPGVNRNVIHFQKWVIPQKTILDQFNSIILSILNIIHKNKKEEANLSHIRDTLLPKLMSGKIRISEKLKIEKGLI
jgi:type I restriction enzyme S subunit